MRNRMQTKQTNFFFLFLVILFSTSPLFAQTQQQLHQKITTIIGTHRAAVGVAVTDAAGKEIVTVNGDKHFAMQSVYKFHLALAVLHLVDEGSLRLEQIITIKKKDIDKDTHSPLRDAHPDEDIAISIKELLRYSVSLSDNNACDVLFELAGGTGKVNDYIRSLGINDVAIATTEGEMKKEWQVQFTNWSTPRAATLLLEKWYNSSALRKSSHDYLWSLLVASVKTDRIKGLLPESVIVAHKPGTSGKNEEGVRAAFNDIGIVMLPDGTHFSISVFVNNSKETDEANAKIIAAITRVCYDHFVKP